MNKSYNFCNNCGKNGHYFHQCKNPITSIGIIVYRKAEHGIEYLLIRRKDSLGYVDFMRGKYHVGNKLYLKNIMNEMTIEERRLLLLNDFDTLWKELWGEHIGIQYRSEEKISREKFKLLKSGISTIDGEYTLVSLINEIDTKWEEPEWGFPKGRRNYQEKDIICALREFEEETGYARNQIKIIQNIIPFEEIFTGSNYKSYKHKYYLAYMTTNKNIKLTEFQQSEVSKLEWFTFDECKKHIRPYNLEKVEVLQRVNKLINDYRLYS